MRALLVSTMLLAAAAGSRFEVPARLQQLLDDGRWDGTPASFRIIALSNLADGCVGQARAHPERQAEAQRCVAQAVRRAKALPWRDDGLFLSHLNLVYGAADELGACADEARHRALSEALRRRSLADPTRHAASYERLAFRWPADQAATLASLTRFDRAHGTALAAEPVEAWRTVMAAHLDEATGLPVSEVTLKAPGAKHPRGCAQSFLTRYVAEFDPALAASWWDAYRAHHLVRLAGTVGFREWPRGVERKGDVDSGPIIFGIGAAASAFGISAAKSQGDVALAAQLEASADLVMATGAGGAAARTVLAQAIRYQARWQPAAVTPR